MKNTLSVRLNSEQLETRETPAAASIFAVGSGSGGPPRLQIFNVTTGVKVADFLAFENSFTGGVNAAIGDVTGDNVADVIVGAGVGGGPRVRVFDGRAFAPGFGFPTAPLDGAGAVPDAIVVADFFAFESTQRGGTNVAAGNFAGAGNAELVIGAGPGGGPRIRILDGAAVTFQGRNFTSDREGDTVANFFAFEPSFRNGVSVAASPTPFGGLEFSNLVVAPGFGGGPRVRVLSGAQIAQRGLQYTSFDPNQTIADFFAFDPSIRSGLSVAAADFNRDGFVDLAVGTGRGVTGAFTVYSGASVLAGNFSGNRAGDILTQEFISNYSNGVSVGAAIIPNGVNNGLLIVGTGGQGLFGQAEVSQFLFGAGFLQRQVVYNLLFDPNFRGGVFVSQ
ncbi:MAG: FG-GAP repeat protein [Planctomycetia bacterium]|nr:FG-GAP repeat protein [Planctomycetia bacterium]